MNDDRYKGMNDEERLEAKRTLYAHLTHAVQSGVSWDQRTWKPTPEDRVHNTEGKSLRTGLNVVLCSHSALATLLMEKGVISEEEYFDACNMQLAEEMKNYERKLSARIGKDVTLA